MRKRFFLTLLLLIVMIQSLAMGTQFSAAAAASAQAEASTLTTDFADYIPGAFVNLFGANGQPGESVDIIVNHDAGQTWSYNSDPADITTPTTTPTSTPVPPTPTPTNTPTSTPVPPTPTPTNTPTSTPVPPTATPTNTPTNTPVPPTPTPTNTPTSTPTNTPVPPTATPTNTPTSTPVPPTPTSTNTPTSTPTNTPTPTPQPHIGTIGFWKNWRNHYNSTQFQLLINYLKTNNPKVYNKDLTNGTGDDLTVAKVDAIFNLGKSTPRDQMILAQLTALKFNLAITQLDGSGGLVQKNDDICLAGVINVSGFSGATAFFGTSTPTVQQVVDAVENRWTGNLTTNRNNWKFNFSNNAQREMIIRVLTGINEGTIITSSGCP